MGEFAWNRNGITVRGLNRNNPASARHAYALYWSTPVSDRDVRCQFSRHILVGAAPLTHATHTLATRGRLAAHRAGAI